MHIDLTTPPPAKNIQNPPGFAPPAYAKDLKSASRSEVWKRDQNQNELKLKRAWEMAFAPAKSLPMQGIMLYFSGSGVQIFSLGMIFMLITGPLGQIANIFRSFEPFRTSKMDGQLTYILLIPPMIVFTLCQCAVFALGLYKCWTMGILPSGPADWLQFETRGASPEWSDASAAAMQL